MRKEKLARGSDALYWVAKIEANKRGTDDTAPNSGGRAGGPFVGGSPTFCGILGAWLKE